MGVPLFGVNISGILHNATKGKLVPLTLTRFVPTTRDSENLAGGLRPTTVAYTGEGFIDDKNLQGAGVGFRPDDAITRKERQVTIIGDSLLPLLASGARVEPLGDDPDAGTVGDKITILGITYAVVRVKADPAKATYLCSVRA